MAPFALDAALLTGVTTLPNLDSDQLLPGGMSASCANRGASSIKSWCGKHPQSEANTCGQCMKQVNFCPCQRGADVIRSSLLTRAELIACLVCLSFSRRPTLEKALQRPMLYCKPRPHAPPSWIPSWSQAGMAKLNVWSCFVWPCEELAQIPYGPPRISKYLQALQRHACLEFCMSSCMLSRSISFAHSQEEGQDAT